MVVDEGCPLDRDWVPEISSTSRGFSQTYPETENRLAPGFCPIRGEWCRARPELNPVIPSEGKRPKQGSPAVGTDGMVPTIVLLGRLEDNECNEGERPRDLVHKSQNTGSRTLKPAWL